MANTDKRLNDLNFDTLSKGKNSNEAKSDSDDDNTSKFSDKYQQYDDQVIERKFDFKVILIGDVAVGKTSIFSRFIKAEFPISPVCTVEGAFKGRSISLDTKTTVDLQVWDTAGQEKFKSLTRAYFVNAHGILIVFDLTNRLSFDSIEKWMKDVYSYGPKAIEVLIVGNKSDSEDRKVSFEDAELLANRVNSTYVEVSAKNGTNILLLFEMLSFKMVKRFRQSTALEEEELSRSSRHTLINHEDSKAEKLIRLLQDKENEKKEGCC